MAARLSPFTLSLLKCLEESLKKCFNFGQPLQKQIENHRDSISDTRFDRLSVTNLLKL